MRRLLLLTLPTLPACRDPGLGIKDSAGGAESGAHSGLGPDSAASGGEDSAVERVPGSVQTPGAAIFADDVVHALAITLDEAARASLLADPETYVEAELSDGEVSLVVGLRLKGSTSFQPLTGKPSLRVNFDRVVEGQRLDGLEALDLISEVEDPASMSEAIAYRVFRAGGQPASRTGFAWLTIDGEDYGLYTLVEKKDDVLIRQWWPDDDQGSLYESSTEHWPCDLDDGGDPRCDCWEVDELGSEDTRADLEALCAVAADTPAENWYAEIQNSTDWTENARHMAMEMLIDAHDHYAGYMGNVYLYHSPGAGGWSLIPASMNSAFGSSRYVPGSCGSSGRTPYDFDGGLLARRCWADEACAEDLLATLGWAVDALEGSDVLETIDAWEALLAPYAEADPKSGYSAEDFALQVGCIRDWLEARPAELAPLLPVDCLGEGGALDVRGWGDLSTNGSCDREHPDAARARVLRVDGAELGLAADPEGIAAGDEVLIVVLQAGDDAAAVGAWALAEVAAVGAASLGLTAAPALGLDGELGDLLVTVQRVPHYEQVLIRAGGTLTAGAWDGETGGVLALRVSGTLTIEEGGALSVAGLGYGGGATGASYNVDGWQGESLLGTGLGGADSAAGYNEANGAWAANLGGGGCNIDGGGGEHAGGATGGSSWNGVATAPEAGSTYGDDDLSMLHLGSGGGGVVNLGAGAGPGGAGGGVLLVQAGALLAEGAGAITASGEDATAWASGSWTYGAGGGAGGTLWLQVGELRLGEGAALAVGGLGYADVTRPGGDGGRGRIRVDCDTVNGTPCADGAFTGLGDPELVHGGAGGAGAW